MGDLEAWARLTVVRRLCGQDSMGPSGVLDQSLASITLAISPPQTSQRDTASGVESTCCGLCSPRSMADAPDAVRPSGVIVFPIAPLILQEIFSVFASSSEVIGNRSFG